ncbi:MAG: hypothetical protein AAFQ80_23960 [Cyanobacteria bacterium J06621_8]
MPKVCSYGFSCASMLLQPGLTAEDCPNRLVCGTIIQLTEEEEAELYAARMENNRRVVRTVMMSQHRAAQRLLRDRGCPQTAETIGIEESTVALIDTISQCQELVEQLTSYYVAPPGVEAHRYLVKRPYATYQYNKLTSKRAIFPPQQEDTEVKVLHLSRDTDPRNILGRSGIERRNRILFLKTQMEKATELLSKAMESVEDVSIEEVVTHKIFEQA